MNTHAAPDAFAQALVAVQSIIEFAGNRGLIIGGVAVSLLAKPRYTADIGQTCADFLMQEWQGTQVWELHGPHPLSPNEVAAGFSRTLKRDVKAVVIPESEWSSTLAQMGNSPAAVEAYSEMMRAFNNGTVVFEEHGTKRIQGKTTIDEAVQSWMNTNRQS